MCVAEDEHVLVVPSQLLHRLGYFQGFCSQTAEYLAELLKSENLSFRPRQQVEQDPAYKQLIPYVIFRYSDPGGRQWLFQYTRGSGQGEGRLHHKRSIGIGGHICAADAGAIQQEHGSVDLFAEGMRRELEEEVIVETPYTARCVGLINDDQTPVGRVHLGVVHIFDVERPAVRARENDITEAAFRPVEEILADMEGFESWSVICMKALFG